MEDINRIIEEANAIAAVGSKSKHIRTIFDLSSAAPANEGGPHPDTAGSHESRAQRNRCDDGS